MEGQMQLDAVMCDTLVGMIKERSDAKDSRALALNQTKTSAVSQPRVDCSDVTLEERCAISAISNGRILTVKADVLEMLMRRDFLKYDGQSLVLTGAGSQMD